MGLNYATLNLTNLFNRKQVEINALVGTRATFLCVTEEIALQLGFDITELSQQASIVNPQHPNYPVALAKYLRM